MIKPVDELDPKTVQLADIMVPRTKLPPDLVLGDELGRGANNRVFRAEYQGRDCVLRVPRRRSETQQRGSALWELRHTLCASRLGVGPKVFATWCARHSLSLTGARPTTPPPGSHSRARAKKESRSGFHSRNAAR
jgi:hypothetical protein